MVGCQCTRSSVCCGECHGARLAFNKVSINCQAHLMTLAVKEITHSFRLGVGGWGLGDCCTTEVGPRRVRQNDGS